MMNDIMIIKFMTMMFILFCFFNFSLIDIFKEKCNDKLKHSILNRIIFSLAMFTPLPFIIIVIYSIYNLLKISFEWILKG